MDGTLTACVADVGTVSAVTIQRWLRRLLATSIISSTECIPKSAVRVTAGGMPSQRNGILDGVDSYDRFRHN